MKFRAYPTFKRVIASLAMLIGLGASVAAAAPSDGELLVPLYRSELVSVAEPVSDVIIANPAIADIYVHGEDKISVIGKAVGVTTLRIFNREHAQIRTIDIRVGYDLPGIRQTLFQLFPYEDIAVMPVNNNLALTGMVSSPMVAAKAVEIVNEFLLPSSPQRPRQPLANPNDMTAADTGVINMLKVSSGQQVMLRVRVGEMQRTALKQLGLNWNINNPGDVAFGTGSLLGAGTGLPVRAETYGALAGIFEAGATSVTAMIDALERNDLFKLLAEPNLVAMSGEEAEFLAGGEFPIPIDEEDGRISVQFKQYGVSVRFLPQVLSDSRIRIAVSPEISELTDIGAVDLGTVSIPGLLTRRAKTTVELAPGESFVIAGLLSDRSESTIDQLPGLGELPVLGGLFRSTAFQRNETELVIAVTPYLVDPVTGDEIRLPTDNFRAPSMMEQVFYGALGGVSKERIRASQTPSFEGPIGFIVD